MHCWTLQQLLEASSVHSTPVRYLFLWFSMSFLSFCPPLEVFLGHPPDQPFTPLTTWWAPKPTLTVTLNVQRVLLFPSHPQAYRVQADLFWDRARVSRPQRAPPPPCACVCVCVPHTFLCQHNASSCNVYFMLCWPSLHIAPQQPSNIHTAEVHLHIKGPASRIWSEREPLCLRPVIVPSVCFTSRSGFFDQTRIVLF